MSENANPTDPPSDPESSGEDVAPDSTPTSEEPIENEGEPNAGEAAAEPTQPIDDELSQAARAAQVGPYIPGGVFRPPNTMKILVFVLLCVAGFFVYFVVFAGTSLRRTEMIRQKTLETKLHDYEKQQRFLVANGYIPAGKTHAPLKKEEEAELEGLRAKYGRMKIVDEAGQKSGAGPESPATVPATVPSGTG